MMTEDMRHNGNQWSWRMKAVLIGFGLVGGFLLLAEHRAHVIPFIPWLLLAACPLLHFFMHSRHGQRGNPGHRGDRSGCGARADGDDR